MDYPRVVDQDMEAAERGYRLADGFLRAIGVRHIADQGQNAVIAADPPDVGRGLLEPVFVDVQHRDSGPGAHQGQGHGAAHAYGAACAGYDRDSSC